MSSKQSTSDTSDRAANKRLTATLGLGQSIWYDNMRRGLLASGELAGLVMAGVRGLTSNPTIFEKAIVSSTDYEEALRKLAAAGLPPTKIYEDLAVEDIRGACDLLLPVYDRSNGVDGRVSLEVLPALAANTEQTVSEGLRLAHLVGRPNVMIKVPATPEGIPAIRALTAQGVSVNVTLIFSLLQYEEVIEAYLSGLEERVSAGGKLEGQTSVASFFVSRVDAVCDKQLADKAKAGPADVTKRAEALMGKIAIANAKMAYEIYEGIVAGARWKALVAKGASPQRLLWASTGTKDPKYADTMYLDALIGADTVNTVPPATLTAFMNHGNVSPTLSTGYEEAHAAVAELAALGIDLSRVCHGLLDDGVKSFTASMATLIGAVTARRAALLEKTAGRQRAVLPAPLAEAVEAEVLRLSQAGAPQRLWDGDPTLFTADAGHETSIKTRLGWLRSPALMKTKLAELSAFAAEVRGAGFTDAVLLGMGGSSLAPEVLGAVFAGNANAMKSNGGLRLHVLDNTDPAAVLAVDKLVEGKKTLFIVASKSGGTIEIQSFERHFWQKTLAQCEGDVARAGGHFVAITDPATRLGQLAEEKKYRRVFVNPADIGGRYSALSYFGLVPGALLGADVPGLVATSGEMAAASSPVVPAPDAAALRLGVIMGVAAKNRRDKLTIVASPELASLGSWIEQLVAESTGKEGKGVVPVDLEPLGAPADYGDDRLFVYIRLGEGDAAQSRAVGALEQAGHPVVYLTLESRAALGRELFRWEVATAIAGVVLGVNPFDEPNVTEAKLATSALLAAYAKDAKLPQAEDVCGPGDVERLRALLSTAPPQDYVALCAYFTRTDARDALLTKVRVAIRARAKNATTVGYGPRFLHSTGQLHKGGANTGVFLQLTADAPKDLPIPGEPYTFATLRNAQALGDLQVLRRRSRRALRVNLGADIDAGLAALLSTIEKA
ncbi:MAG TPA: bifunctional transaldolase/phosoglucose isomerase [Polyangia bacterium]|jgi:transaldolase/glucose-6-phosphate isomerase|nr:bifunctional transaldolase/phosoglucose isomerase [Polyangia bacterium]